MRVFIAAEKNAPANTKKRFWPQCPIVTRTPIHGVAHVAAPSLEQRSNASRKVMQYRIKPIFDAQWRQEQARQQEAFDADAGAKYRPRRRPELVQQEYSAAPGKPAADQPWEQASARAGEP